MLRGLPWRCRHRESLDRFQTGPCLWARTQRSPSCHSTSTQKTGLRMVHHQWESHLWTPSESEHSQGWATSKASQLVGTAAQTPHVVSLPSVPYFRRLVPRRRLSASAAGTSLAVPVQLKLVEQDSSHASLSRQQRDVYRLEIFVRPHGSWSQNRKIDPRSCRRTAAQSSSLNGRPGNFAKTRLEFCVRWGYRNDASSRSRHENRPQGQHAADQRPGQTIPLHRSARALNSV